MKRLFFACITSPKVAIDTVKSLGMRPFVVPLGTSLKDSPRSRKADVLVVLTFRHFLSLLPELNACKKDVLLFAGVTHVRRLSAGHYLDAVKPRVGLHRTQFREFDVAAFDTVRPLTEPVAHEDTYLHKLVDQVREGSLLNRLMTIIYRVGNAATQRELRQVIVKWFVEDHSDLKLLARAVAATLQVPEDSKVVAAFVKVCNDPTYLEVFKDIKARKGAAKPLDYKKLRKDHPKVDMFEVTFMLKTYDQTPSELNGKTLTEIFKGRDRNKEKFK